MRSWDLLLPSVNYLSGRGSFCQLSSTLLESAGLSVNFRQIFVVLQDLLSTFSASEGTFVNFCQLSVHPQYLPSPSVNFSCTYEIFRKTFVRLLNLPSTLVDFPCICRTYCKLASIYREAGGPPANLGQLYVCPWDFLSTFPVAGGPSVNFSCVRRTLHQLP